MADLTHRDAHTGRREEQRHLDVVLQMLADMRRIDPTRNADRFEFAARTDAGQQQKVWRTDRAGAQDHFLAREGDAGLARGRAILDARCLNLPRTSRPAGFAWLAPR